MDAFMQCQRGILKNARHKPLRLTVPGLKAAAKSLIALGWVRLVNEDEDSMSVIITDDGLAARGSAPLNVAPLRSPPHDRP